MEHEHINNLNDLRQLHIDHAKQEFLVVKKATRPVEPLLDDLDDISKKIIDHLEHGDHTDQELNSKLWHRLKNVTHRLDSFSNFAEESTEKMLEEAHKIIDPLFEQRPPKDYH